jgi:O-antigen ligase
LIRLSLLYAVVFGLAVYAWRDWFKSLCGLILLMAVIEHPDMPKSLADVQGLNPWNFLLLAILLSWAANRRGEGLRWDMPAHVNVLLACYVAVLLSSFYRLVADRESLELPMTAGQIVGERLVNVVKWIIPGLLLYDGARSRERFTLALMVVLAVYFLLAVQVIRWMPVSAWTSGEELTRRAAKRLVKEVGYHRVNLSMMLAGAFWAVLAAREMIRTPGRRFLMLLAAFVVALGQALTGGRTGYGTWAVVGLLLCLVRWRKYLLLAPLVAVLVVWLVPGSTERMLRGFERRDVLYDDEIDEYEVTSGRTLIWPYVVAKIEESLVVGYGGMAMERTGLRKFLLEELGELFGHPHNMYLEMLLDNGWVGVALVAPFYLVVLVKAFSLFVDRRSGVFTGIGGATLALVLALLVAGVGSQTFYPREGSVGMWCCIGLMLRVHVERARVLARERRRTAESRTEAWVAPAPASAAWPARASRPAAQAETLDAALWARAS